MSRELLPQLRTCFDDCVHQVLSGARTVVLIDYPDHDNIGDSAIWLGVIDAFRRLNVSICYAASHLDFRPALIQRLPSDIPIFLNGGGNLGDLWLAHQRLREHVIERFRSRRIVQLPQTIHFRNRARAADTARLLATHPSFTLLTRDHMSAEYASDVLGQQSILCPDAAFAIDSLVHLGVAPPTRPIVGLWRQDAEAGRRDLDGIPDEIPNCDWYDHPRARERRLRRLASRRVAQLAGASRHSRGFTLASFNQMAVREVRRGLGMLSQGQCIVTDRLHAIILATLIERPQVAVENSYGKLRAVHDTWLSSSGLTRFARDAPSAVHEATQWSERVRAGEP
jgi:pyruvyl transferase EpsO